jgi:N-acetylglutamate synthase-like GNAT family acetyltransferase
MTCSVDMDSAYRIRTAEAKDAAAITSLIQQLAAHDRESTPLTADYAARWLANPD